MRLFDKYGRLVTSGEGYEHEQTIPSQEWKVEHEMGRVPAVTIYVAGLVSYARVENHDEDTLTVYFNESVTGTVVCQ
jgi:hypothetical protein